MSWRPGELPRGCREGRESFILAVELQREGGSAGGGAGLAARAQDSSLCTATVMLSCFWIMMFLQKGEGDEGGELGLEQGGGQGDHRAATEPIPIPELLHEL